MYNLKIIMVPFGGSDHEISALDMAFRLARVFQSYVRVLYIAPDPRAAFAAYCAGYGFSIPTAGLEKDIEKHNKEKQKAAKAKYIQLVEQHGIVHDEDAVSSDRAAASFEVAIGDAANIVAVQGRLADLIVMGRAIQDVNTDYAGSAISALFNSGRPVLFTPLRKIEKEIGLKVLIAWNGSSQAARAVDYAMPLLKRASSAAKVWVLTVDTDESKNFAITAQALCLYLKQHGIETESVIAKDNGLAAGAEILSQANYLKADMVVMGAFSHSRVKEMILGGVTNFMLDNADIPIFMAY